jgi:hypothetical protein
MINEICPVGTESLLAHLGYHLNADRTAWGREKLSDLFPEVEDPAAIDLLNEVSMDEARRITLMLDQESSDKVMSVDQLKYRRLQAVFMHRGF